MKKHWIATIGVGVLTIGLLAGYGVSKLDISGSEQEKTDLEPVRVELPEQKPDSIYTYAPLAPVETPDSEEQTPYDFAQPVPERDAVDNSYFEDAVFIGDSRTDGFMLFSGVGCGENLTSNGLSIFKLEEKRVFRIDGEKYTLGEALDRKQYGKIYLSLGVNELGYRNDEGFYQAYLEVVDFIRERQPDAVFYIQGLIPVNEEVVASVGGPDYFENGHLKIYNELMQKVSKEKQVAFLDLYAEFADENGSLPQDASQDGIHLSTSYCKRWLEYLQRHTVDPEIFDQQKVETGEEMGA